jgi:hypothetical protein
MSVAERCQKSVLSEMQSNSARRTPNGIMVPVGRATTKTISIDNSRQVLGIRSGSQTGLVEGT